MRNALIGVRNGARRPGSAGHTARTDSLHHRRSVMLVEQQLLAAICADPHDLAARLAYADLLEEGGDPDRAEFIRLQFELDSVPYAHPRYSALRKRERCLLAEHERVWADLGPGVHSCVFRRGFVEAARMTAGNFLRHAGRLFRRSPLHRVRLTRIGPHLDRLLRSRYLARLSALDLTYTQLGDAGAEALAACSYLA